MMTAFMYVVVIIIVDRADDVSPGETRKMDYWESCWFQFSFYIFKVQSHDRETLRLSESLEAFSCENESGIL